MKIQFKRYYFIVISNSIVRILGKFVTLGNDAMAITIYPFIFVRHDAKDNQELLRHEMIHIRQQLELLLIGAILLYMYEYLYARYVKKLNPRDAYYYTALEQEAHRNAMNETYLEARKPYAVLTYIRNKKWLARGSDGRLIEKEYA